MQILHLSDLHYTSSDPALTNILAEPLFEDLRTLTDTGLAPDFIVFSGDLVHDPDDDDVYSALVDSVLTPMQRLFDIPSERFLVVPGNHDVSRVAIKKNRLQYDGMQKAKVDPEYVEGLLKNGDLEDYQLKINGQFFSFSSPYGFSWTNPLYARRDFNDLNISVLALNSTLACSLEGSRTDHGKLVIPSSVLERAILAVPKERLLLTCCHHPHSNFHDPYLRQLERIIEGRSYAHFSGHLHDPKPTLLTSARGRVLFLQAGALYEKTDYFKGYSILYRDSDTGHTKIEYRTYYDTRRKFGKGENVCEDGIFYTTDDAKTFWQSVRVPVHSAAFRTWLTTTIFNSLQSEYGKEAIYPFLAASGRTLLDVYVFPTIAERGVTIVAGEDPAFEENGRVIAEDEILSSNRNLVVSFPFDFGATAFLKFLAIRSAQTAHTLELPRIPLYIDIRSIKATYAKSALRALKQAHPEVDDPRFGWRSKAHEQPYLILIDNYENSNAQHRRALGQLVAEAPKARFVIAQKVALLALDVAAEEAVFPLQHCKATIVPLNRRRIRALVKSLVTSKTLSDNALVQEVQSRFAFLGIPLAAPLVSMYLLIRDQFNKFNPLNISSILDSFIRQLLLKNMEEHSILGEFFRSGFDTTEQTAVLAYISERMTRDNVATVKADAYICYIQDYYSHVGIARDTHSVARFLVDCRILEKVGDEVAFKYGLFQSYFLARRMQAATEALEYVLHEERFGRHVQELDIYFGLNRHDEKSLDTIGTQFERMHRDLVPNLQAFFGSTELSTIELPRVKDLTAFRNVVTRKLMADVSAARADQILDEDDLPREFSRKVWRPELKNAAMEWFLGLRAYSVAIKNLEGIAKPAKEKHLKKVLEAWGEAIGITTRILSVSIDAFEDFRTISDISNELDGRAMRVFLSNVPRMIVTTMSGDLASAKLDEQFKALARHPSAATEFVRISMMADLKLPGYMEEIGAYLDRFRKSEFIREATLWKLRDVYLRYGFGPRDDAAFRRIIAETDAGLRRFPSEKDRNDHISKLLQQYKKRKAIFNQRQ
jgi:predicted MPP superfamily phosphohydrolase